MSEKSDLNFILISVRSHWDLVINIGAIFFTSNKKVWYHIYIRIPYMLPAIDR